MIGVHFFIGDREYFAGRCLVNVYVVMKGLQEVFVARQVSHDAQFNL